MSSQTLRTVQVSHRFEAAPERVYDAWLKPEQVAKWMAAPAQAIMGTQDEILHIEVDPRVGGKFSFLVRRQGQEIDHVGEYLEMDRPRRLVFTWGAPVYSSEFSHVSLDLVPDGAGTLVTLTATNVLAEYAERTQQGWASILGKIAASL
jgi:uncharacterized protein YndB with AHSA1/START domain